MIGVIAAVCLPIAARAFVGPRGALVHIRWDSSVDVSARQELEARFRLEDGERLDDSTWRYDLVNPSAETIRALVGDSAVADTHHINRERSTLSDAERTARRARVRHGSVIVAVADRMAALAALAALVMVLTQWYARQADGLWTWRNGLIFRTAEQVQPYVWLAVLGLAIYGRAIWWPPTNSDDLQYLASVRLRNPFSYFVGDHGHDNNLYRPLTPASMWVVYQMFGVWNVPNQILNQVVHLANVSLLYAILRRAQPDRSVALLFAAIFMISEYTWLAATVTSHRQVAQTGLFLLVFVYQLTRHAEPSDTTAPAASVRLGSMAALSVLALMSKESGLVVPALAFAYAFMSGRPRARLAAAAAATIAGYVVFRVVIFGPSFASYGPDGYMFFGLLHYQRSDELPSVLRYINYAENVLKNIIAPMLPVFDETGALLSRESLPVFVPVIVSTALLTGIAAARRLSHLQWIALIIIVANAVAHYATFRMRAHYVSHAAFCMFVAGSPLLGRGRSPGVRDLAVKTLGVMALLGGIVLASNMMDRYALAINRALDALPVRGLERYGPVAEEVLQRYR